MSLYRGRSLPELRAHHWTGRPKRRVSDSAHRVHRGVNHRLTRGVQSTATRSQEVIRHCPLNNLSGQCALASASLWVSALFSSLQCTFPWKCFLLPRRPWFSCHVYVTPPNADTGLHNAVVPSGFPTAIHCLGCAPIPNFQEGLHNLTDWSWVRSLIR